MKPAIDINYSGDLQSLKKTGRYPKGHKSRKTKTHKMETFENNQHPENSIIINSEVKDYLLQTSKWAKFLAIMGYVGVALLILIALVFVFGSSLISEYSYSLPSMGYVSYLYLIIAVAYYFPISYLYKFSVEMKKGLDSNDEQSITLAFKNLKSLFRFMGIFTIVVLSLYVVIIVGAIIGGMMSML